MDTGFASGTGIARGTDIARGTGIAAPVLQQRVITVPVATPRFR